MPFVLHLSNWYLQPSCQEACTDPGQGEELFLTLRATCASHKYISYHTRLYLFHCLLCLDLPFLLPPVIFNQKFTRTLVHTQAIYFQTPHSRQAMRILWCFGVNSSPSPFSLALWSVLSLLYFFLDYFSPYDMLQIRYYLCVYLLVSTSSARTQVRESRRFRVGCNLRV